VRLSIVETIFDLFFKKPAKNKNWHLNLIRNESQGGRPLPKTAGNLKTQSLSAKKARISTTTTNVWNDTDDDAWLCDEENWIEPDVSGMVHYVLQS